MHGNSCYICVVECNVADNFCIVIILYKSLFSPNFVKMKNRVN